MPDEPMQMSDDGETTIITDLDAFLESYDVPMAARPYIVAHVFQAFAAGFLLEHSTSMKSASRYPFGGTDPELLRPAFDEWAERRWDF